MATLLTAQAAQSDPSLECSVRTSSQVETAQCLANVEADAATALETLYGAARASATELDLITGRDVAVPALEQAQAAWQDYRDAQCDYRGALFGGGSGTGIEIRTCRIELTRDRIRALKATLR